MGKWEPELRVPVDYGTFRSAAGITEAFVRSLPGPAILKVRPVMSHGCGV